MKFDVSVRWNIDLKGNTELLIGYIYYCQISDTRYLLHTRQLRLERNTCYENSHYIAFAYINLKHICGHLINPRNVNFTSQDYCMNVTFSRNILYDAPAADETWLAVSQVPETAGKHAVCCTPEWQRQERH